MGKQQLLTLVGLLVVLLYVVSDASNRVWKEQNTLSSKKLEEQLLPLPMRSLSPAQMEDLVALYSPFKDVEGAGHGQNNQSDTNQDLLLENDPTRLLLNGHLLELKAIVSISVKNANANDLYVLIKDTDIKSQKSEMVRLKNNQLIYGHKLEILDSTHVKLINDLPVSNGIIAGKDMVLAMYKRNDNVPGK